MVLYLSKLLPLFIFPIGLACLALIAALVLWRWRGWSATAVTFALLVLWLGGNRLVTMAVAQSLEWRHEPLSENVQADVIVVLGGGTRAHAYPRPINEMNDAGDRLLYALHLYNQGVAPKVLLSGGVVAFTDVDRPSEAKAMASILAMMGMAEEDVWLEENSRNTYENAVESLKILEDQGLDEIVLVTSALHMPRSIAIFEQQGASIIPAPTDYYVTQADWDYYLTPALQIQITNLIPSSTDLDLTSRVIKEYMGFLIYRLRGWL